MIDVILKIVNITSEDLSVTKKKRNLIRKSLVYIQNVEIIDTVMNLYVDMVCAPSESTPKEVITAYLQSQPMASEDF